MGDQREDTGFVLWIDHLCRMTRTKSGVWQTRNTEVTMTTAVVQRPPLGCSWVLTVLAIEPRPTVVLFRT
jgi:hypothetical protein